MFLNDSRIEWEAFNGKKYKIKDDNKKLNQIKADFLAKLDEKATKIIKYMYDNNLPTKEIAHRTHNRYKGVGETPLGEKSGAAYTINKGQGGIYICCITKR